MFGERLAQLRKKKNLSQYELANRMSFSRGQIANYEQGKRQPDYETLQKFADFFEVTTDYLLGRTDRNIETKNNEDKFEAFANDPELQQWYKELPKSPEDRLRKLKKLWEIIKDEE